MSHDERTCEEADRERLLGRHVRQIDRTEPADRDALLTELLVHVYPTRALQDS